MLTQFSDLYAALVAEGYRSGQPPGADIDKAYCRQSRCDFCGRRLEYVGLVRKGSYRAFAFCGACDAAIEI